MSAPFHEPASTASTTAQTISEPQERAGGAMGAAGGVRTALMRAPENDVVRDVMRECGCGAKRGAA